MYQRPEGLCNLIAVQMCRKGYGGTPHISKLKGKAGRGGVGFGKFLECFKLHLSMYAGK